MRFDFIPRADDLDRKATQKPAPGSTKVDRKVRKLKQRNAIERTVADVAKEANRADREIRFHCFLRDHRRCRAFGTPLKFDTDNEAKKAHNHHIVFRSALGSDDPSNRITLSWKAHQMIHEQELEIVEPANANEAVTFRQYTFKTSGEREFVREWVSQP